MMIDSVVHFHVFPRFRNGFCFDKYVLEDKYFPKPVDLTDGFSLDDVDLFLNFLKNK